MQTKIKKLLSWPRVLALVALVMLIGISTTTPLIAQTVTRSFKSEQMLQRGMLVMQNQEDKTKIEAITKDREKLLFGLVVSANDSPITLSNEDTSFFVATVGTYDALISTQNGPIKTGDYLTISSINGIGMKADDSDQTILGTSLEDFDGSNNVVSTQKIKDDKDKEKDVQVGRIKVDISVANNPLYKDASSVPQALKSITETVAGQELSLLRVYISVIVFLITVAMSVALMYGGIRSAVTSIGRNPLSKKQIMRGMSQVSVTGLIVFITGMFGVYLILKL